MGSPLATVPGSAWDQMHAATERLGAAYAARDRGDVADLRRLLVDVRLGLAIVIDDIDAQTPPPRVGVGRG